jgi:hypothetical protein
VRIDVHRCLSGHCVVRIDVDAVRYFAPRTPPSRRFPKMKPQLVEVIIPTPKQKGRGFLSERGNQKEFKKTNFENLAVSVQEGKAVKCISYG